MNTDSVMEAPVYHIGLTADLAQSTESIQKTALRVIHSQPLHMVIL